MSTDIHKDALLTPERLRSYCVTKGLGEGRTTGKETLFCCPFGNHTSGKLHLAVAEKNGIGVWRCRSCDMGGDIFSLDAKLLGIDLTGNFSDVMRSVAEAVGYSLPEDPALSVPVKGKRMSPKRRAARPFLLPRLPRESFSESNGEMAVSLAPAAKEAWTPGDDFFFPVGEEPRFKEARLSWLNAGLSRGRWCEELSLPRCGLDHLADFPERGGLGLWGNDRLAMFYMMRDNLGYLRTFAVKVRLWPWEYMNEDGSRKMDEHGRETGKFFFVRGSRLIAPWGIEEARGNHFVIVTEGESDAMALKCSKMAFVEAWSEEGVTYEDLPAVIAVGGTGGLKNEFLPLLIGKRVLLAYDNDEAGEAAFIRDSGRLSEFALSVGRFSASVGRKDLRATFNRNAPAMLFANAVELFGKQ